MMKKNKGKFDSPVLLSGLLPLSLALMLYGVLGLPGTSPGLSAYSAAHAAGDNAVAAISHTATDLSALSFFYNDYEIEIEVEEDDDNHRVFRGLSAQLRSLPLILNERISTSSFLDKKPVKLFILFHSWKSFLLV